MAEIVEANRYITKMRLENFQSHKDTQISFHSGINLILGSSDAGKTAILRALNFILHNEWYEAYLRFGEDECRVSIWFSDGVMVQRIKGNIRNAVLIRHPGNSGEAFEKFGKVYPKEVLDALGNPPQDERHGAISYAEQSAPLFLVSLSSTELPRSISELTGIDDFDEASSFLSKKSKQADRQAKESLVRIAKHNEDLLKYETLDSEINRSVLLEKRRKNIQISINDIDEGYVFYEKFKDIMRQGKEATKSLSAAQKIVGFKDQLTKVKEKTDELVEMDKFIQSYESLERDEIVSHQALLKAEKISSTKLRDALTSIKDVLQSFTVMEDFLKDYQSLMTEGKAIQTEMLQWKDIIKNKTKEAEQIRVELQSAGAWCIACDRPLLEDVC